MSDGGSVGEGLVGGTPVGKKQGPGALGLPMQKGGSVRVTHSPAALSPSHSRGVGAPGPGSTCAGWGGGRWEDRGIKAGKDLASSCLRLPQGTALSLYPEPGCNGGR